MARMTINKSGSFINFLSPTKANIRSLKVHFSPTQSGTGDPSPENVRPISGRDGVTVSCCGKNFINTKSFDSYPDINMDNDGYYVGKIRAFRYANEAIPVLPATSYKSNTVYVVTAEYYFTNVGDFKGGVLGIRTHYTDGSENWGVVFSPSYEGVENIHSQITYTTSGKTVDYFEFRLVDSRGNDYILHVKNFQIEEAKPTSYEPYIGQVYPITFGRTIYGGCVDLINATVTDEYISRVIGSASYSSGVTTTTSGLGVVYYNTGQVFGSNSIADYDEPIITNYFKQIPCESIASVTTPWTFMINGTGTRLIFFGDSTLTTKEAWTDYLRENQIYIYAKTTVPITYQIDSTNINCLQGVNNFWSNADSIDIEYDLVESQEIILAKKRIMLDNQPHRNHILANAANFATTMASPLKQCVTHFSPWQSGSGTPTPDNVRPIMGWNEATVTRCGKNLLDEEFLSDLKNYPIQGGYGYYHTEPIFLEPNTSYVFKFTTKPTYETTRYWAVRTYDDAYEDINDPGTTRYLVSNMQVYDWGITTGAKGAIRFAVYGGQTTLDEIWDRTSVQLEYGQTRTDFEPFNGNAISVSFPAVGKNLVPNPIHLNRGYGRNIYTDHNGFEATDTGIKGTPENNSTGINVLAGYVEKGNQYTISCQKVGNCSRWAYGIYYYNTIAENCVITTIRSYVSSFYTTWDPVTFTASDDGYVWITYHQNLKTTEEFEIKNIQLEQGSTATEYEPFNNTIYSGYVDLINGEIVQTHSLFYLSPDLSFTDYDVSDTIHTYRLSRTKNPYNDIMLNGNIGFVTNYFSYGSAYYETEWGCFRSAFTRAFEFYTPKSIDTLEKFLNIITEHPLYMVAPLAEPIHYPIPPTTLRTLRGTNNIYSDTNGLIDITYWTRR